MNDAVAGSARPSPAPQIAVVVAVRNGVSTLPVLLDSLRRQRGDFEVIVADGGSTDGTVELVRRSGDVVTRFLEGPDRGIYHAWNRALAVARAPWIAYLGADDHYEDGALERYGAVLRDLDPEVDYVSSRVRVVSAGGRSRVIGAAWQWPRFQRSMTVAHVGSLHHRRLYERHGLYDERFRICGDYELLLRPRAALRAAWFDQVTATMADGGISTASLRRAFGEAERAKAGAGGRSAWRCRIECEWDIGKVWLKRAVLGWPGQAPARPQAVPPSAPLASR